MIEQEDMKRIIEDETGCALVTMFIFDGMSKYEAEQRSKLFVGALMTSPFLQRHNWRELCNLTEQEFRDKWRKTICRVLREVLADLRPS